MWQGIFVADLRTNKIAGGILSAAKTLFPWPAAVVLLPAGIEIALLWIRSSGYWSNGGFGPLARLAFSTLIVASWVTVIWCFHWFLVCTHALLRFSTRRQIWHRALLGTGSIAAMLYLTAWVFFWRVGVFPDADAFVFAFVNIRMLLSYFWQAERTAVVSPQKDVELYLCATV